MLFFKEKEHHRHEYDINIQYLDNDFPNLEQESSCIHVPKHLWRSINCDLQSSSAVKWRQRHPSQDPLKSGHSTHTDFTAHEAAKVDALEVLTAEEHNQRKFMDQNKTKHLQHGGGIKDVIQDVLINGTIEDDEFLQMREGANAAGGLRREVQ
jgi:hypothetical protein